MAFYGRQIVWPIDLTVDYGRTPSWVWDHATGSVAVGIAGSIVAVAGLLWAVRRRGRLVPAGLAVFAVGVGPVLGLVPFTYQYWSTVTDRYLYLPMVGVSLIAAWAVQTDGRPARAAAAAVLALWAVLAFVQVGVWRDTTTLFAHNLALNPNSAFAHAGLGLVAERSDDLPLAERHYRAAVALDPGEPKYAQSLYKVLSHQPGREAEARAAFAEVVMDAARRVVRKYPDAPIGHSSLARAYELQGRRADAAAERARAAQLRAGGHADPPPPGDDW